MTRPVVTPYRQGEPSTFATLLCDGYVVRNAGSMRALVETYQEAAARHPQARLLSTLDDLDQAFYTSAHASEFHKLDDTEGYDLSSVDRAAFENGEHLGYLSTKSEFFIRHGNLMKKAAGVAFTDVRGKLYWAGDDGEDFVALNAHADAAVDDEIYLQIVPVARAFEAIAAFPNGYFTSDLTPFEIAAIARRFEETYGYTLFAIGASYVGFLRGRALSAAEVKAFSADVAALFADAPGDAPSQIARVIGASPVLLLNYTTN